MNCNECVQSKFISVKNSCIFRIQPGGNYFVTFLDAFLYRKSAVVLLSKVGLTHFHSTSKAWLTLANVMLTDSCSDLLTEVRMEHKQPKMPDNTFFIIFVFNKTEADCADVISLPGGLQTNKHKMFS